MKIYILTQEEYWNFVIKTLEGLPEGDDHFTVSVTGNFPDEYDAGISFMWTKRIPKEELDKATWFNFHPAPLPEYKGRDLCYHAIMNGEKEFGATLHYMDEGFDTGDIIDVRRFPLYDYYNAEDVSKMAISVSEALFMTYLPLILETPVFPRLRNVGGTYYKKGQIIEEVPVKPDSDFGQFIRAVSFPSKGFHPCIDIGGVKYKIVREE